MTINEKITKSVKNEIKLAKFKYINNEGVLKYEYRFNSYIKFNEIDKLFNKSPKIKNGESSYCYVLNSLKNNATDEVLYHRAKLENVDIPFIVYVDIDFKKDKELELFKKDYGNTPEHFLNELKKDTSVWVSGHSGGGKGIRILFLVFNYWAHTNKFIDYKIIYNNNYQKILKRLKESYNLNLYDRSSTNYIDHSPISNMILKTHLCLDDKYKHINKNCAVIIHRDELKLLKIYTNNLTGITLDDSKNLPDVIFEHYSDEMLSNVQYGDETFRKEIYQRYKKSYLHGGMQLQLNSFDVFNNYINTKNYKYPYPLSFFNDINLEIENNTIEVDAALNETENDEVKKFNKALSILNTYDALDYTISVFDPNKIYVEEKYLLYPLFKETKLAAIFGYTGQGKSIFAMQMADIIARGMVNTIKQKELFKCYTKPQPVVYIDFELGGSSIQSRYSRNGKIRFCDNLIITNVDNLQFDINTGSNKKQVEKNEKVVDFIFSCLRKFNSNIAFVDNLSNIADQVEHAAEADGFIRHLYARAKNVGATIIFVAHTPKVDLSTALSLNQFKGSSSLAKTFESVIGFKRSKEKNISYIKQVKSRDVDLLFDEDNVAKFEFVDDIDGWVLNFIGEDEEYILLPEKKKKAKNDDDFILDVLYDNIVDKIPYRKLEDKYKISTSTVYRYKNKLDDDNFKKKFDEYLSVRKDLDNV